MEGVEDSTTNIKLKEFIKRALIDICDAIAEGRTEVESKYNGNCIIAPVSMNNKKLPSKPSEIHFDLTLEGKISSTSSGGGGLSISVVKAAGSHEKNDTKRNVNRVAFSVPFIPQGLR